MTPTTQLRPRLGIAINLNEMDQLAREYLTEISMGGSEDLLHALTLSGFIVWLRQRQQSNDHEINARR